MRATDCLALFKEAGFDVCRKEIQEDKVAQESMRNGFVVDEGFREYSVDDLCVTGFRVAVTAGRKEGRYGDMITIAVIMDGSL